MSTSESSTLTWGENEDNGNFLDGEETDEEGPDNTEWNEDDTGGLICDTEEVTNINGGGEQGEAVTETPVITRNKERITEQSENSRRRRKEPTWMRYFVSGEEIREEEIRNWALYISNNYQVTYYDAAREKKWQNAMEAEIQTIERNNTWELVHLPPKAKKLASSGCTRPNLMKMESLKSTRLVWLQRDIHKQKE